VSLLPKPDRFAAGVERLGIFLSEKA
jgi:hypothetical protein